MMSCFFFFSSRRRHTRCALVTGVQTCALPILAAYERLLPLEKASNLASRDKVAFLAKTGEGVLGKIVNRVKNAALVAITDGSKQITLEHLKQAVPRPVVCGLRPAKEAARTMARPALPPRTDSPSPGESLRPEARRVGKKGA